MRRGQQCRTARGEAKCNSRHPKNGSKYKAPKQHGTIFSGIVRHQSALIVFLNAQLCETSQQNTPFESAIGTVLLWGGGGGKTPTAQFLRTPGLIDCRVLTFMHRTSCLSRIRSPGGPHRCRRRSSPHLNPLTDGGEDFPVAVSLGLLRTLIRNAVGHTLPARGLGLGRGRHAEPPHCFRERGSSQKPAPWVWSNARCCHRSVGCGSRWGGGGVFEDLFAGRFGRADELF